MRKRSITLIPARVNPARSNVTDRALRYRAQRHADELGEKRCNMCGSATYVEIEHIDGREEHGNPANLMWACRSCNTKKGAHFAKRGAGRRTAQYNPYSGGGAKSLAQWTIAVMSMKGQSNQMSLRDAIAMVQDTPSSRRSEFAREIWARRRARGTDRLDEVPF